MPAQPHSEPRQKTEGSELQCQVRLMRKENRRLRKQLKAALRQKPEVGAGELGADLEAARKENDRLREALSRARERAEFLQRVAGIEGSERLVRVCSQHERALGDALQS